MAGTMAPPGSADGTGTLDGIGTLAVGALDGVGELDGVGPFEDEDDEADETGDRSAASELRTAGIAVGLVAVEAPPSRPTASTVGTATRQATTASQPRVVLRSPITESS